MPESASWGAGEGGVDLIPFNSPLGCGSGSDPPQFPPGRGPGGGLLLGGLLLGGICLGVPPSWGVSLEGVPLGGLLGWSPSWGSPSWVVSLGVVSQHALRQTPPRTESHTAVKNYLGHNFVAAGNNVRQIIYLDRCNRCRSRHQYR